jgi:predicted dehydrogenase
MATRLGVAVVGLGIGEQHARMYATLPQCEVRRLVDLDIGRAERLAAEFPNSVATTNFNDALGGGIDVVSIASFDDAHFDQVLAALDAGKHVFVEKPLCRSARETAEIRKALKARPRLHLCSNLVLRGADLYRWLRAEIAAGAFGDIYAFDGDYLYGRLHKITDGWRGDTDGYSVMLGGGIHLIDLLLWLTGQRPDCVQAASSNLATRNSRFRYDDFTAATLTFSSGLVARIAANFACMHPHQHIVRIFGTERTFILDDAGPRIMEHRDPLGRGAPVDGARPIALATLPTHKGVLIPEFVQAILSGEPPAEEDLGVTLNAITIAAACDEAAASSRPVNIIYQ